MAADSLVLQVLLGVGRQLRSLSIKGLCLWKQMAHVTMRTCKSIYGVLMSCYTPPLPPVLEFLHPQHLFPMSLLSYLFPCLPTSHPTPLPCTPSYFHPTSPSLPPFDVSSVLPMPPPPTAIISPTKNNQLRVSRRPSTLQLDHRISRLRSRPQSRAQHLVVV